VLASQVAQLGGVALPFGQGGSEDGGVGGDPDDVPVADEALQVAAGQQLPGQVIEPDRDALFGQFTEWISQESSPNAMWVPVLGS
jgi:hypothetical protein